MKFPEQGDGGPLRRWRHSPILPIFFALYKAYGSYAYVKNMNSTHKPADYKVYSSSIVCILFVEKCLFFSTSNYGRLTTDATGYWQ